MNVNEQALNAHRVLLRTGLSLANVFAWLFVFMYFESLSGSPSRALSGVALLYALTQLIIIVATPVSAAHLRRGVKHSLIWGVVIASSALVLLGATLGGYLAESVDVALWGIVAFAILLGLYRALYWIPYTLAEVESKPHLGVRAYFEVLLALMPLFAGLTIASVQFAEVRLLFGAAALIALSFLPVLFLTDTRERFSWPYVYTFRQLWRRRNHGLVLQSFLEGIQGAALFLVWPLAIFLIVERSFFLVGFAFSVTLLFVLLLRRTYRSLSRSYRINDSTLVYVVVAVSAWVARLAAGTPFGIIIADAYAYTTTPERGTRIDPSSFEHASDRGSFVDEYTALKELALALGRLKLCAVVFFLAFFAPIPLVLAVALLTAAIASGISAILARRISLAAY